MEDIVKKDLLSVLNDTLNMLNLPNPDPIALRRLSNRTIHNSSIYQDEHSISTAILIYSISKVIEKLGNKVYLAKIKNLLSLAIEYLEDDNIESYHEFMTKIFNMISEIDTKFKFYIHEVINYASVKKGSRIYEHGISAPKTAEILGISLWELQEYIGATKIPDIDEEVSTITSVRERLKFARTLFS